MEGSDYAPNRCVFRNDDMGVWIYHANCLEFMDNVIQHYPDGRFDMIFVDPPYFLSNGGITCHAGKMVRVNKGTWDVSQGAKLNHEFNTAWLLRCQQLLKPHGTIWVSGTHHVIHSIGYAMQQLQMKILNAITWEKPNPPPNLSCRYFTHSFETLLWAAKNEQSKHYFDYATMKAMNRNKQMKAVWTIAPPRKDEKACGKHPTQKPLTLLERIVLASTRTDDLIFDPFTGSGTTGVAALKHGRRFVGCELESAYLDIASQRIKKMLQGSMLQQQALLPPVSMKGRISK